MRMTNHSAPWSIQMTRLEYFSSSNAETRCFMFSEINIITASVTQRTQTFTKPTIQCSFPTVGFTTLTMMGFYTLGFLNFSSHTALCNCSLSRCQINKCTVATSIAHVYLHAYNFICDINHLHFIWVICFTHWVTISSDWKKSKINTMSSRNSAAICKLVQQTLY